MKKNLRALLVEDSEDDALLLVHLLSSGGYLPQWRRVYSRPELLDALCAQEWDIVFSDFHMPRFSGDQALALIRACGFEMPLIIVSGSISNGMANDFKQAGAQDYVMKGNRDQLLDVVRHELDRAPPPRREASALPADVERMCAAAPDFISALTLTLTKTCETMVCTFAQTWIPRLDGAVLECSPAWYCRDEALKPLRRQSLDMTLGPGKDLPGVVWSTQAPLWLDELTGRLDARRATHANNAGLSAAMAVPLLSDRNVVAVFEFFLSTARAQDRPLLQLAVAAASALNAAISTHPVLQPRR